MNEFDSKLLHTAAGAIAGGIIGKIANVSRQKLIWFMIGGALAGTFIGKKRFQKNNIK